MIFTHILATLVGGFVGVIVFACCVVAGQEDKRMECMEKQYHVRQGKSD